MLAKTHCNSVLCTLFVWVVTLCSGFVLISSAAGQNNDAFTLGNALEYEWKSKMFLDENEKSGYIVTGKLVVQNVWEREDLKILKLKLESPKLHVKSPGSSDFAAHASPLEKYQNAFFLVTWKAGKLVDIYLDANEPIALANLKRATASLLQFQLGNEIFQEIDASGHCTSTYTKQSATRISKTKSDCHNPDLIHLSNNINGAMGVTIASQRVVEYLLDESSSRIKTVDAIEVHKMSLSAKEDVEASVESRQSLVLINSASCDTITASSLQEAIDVINKEEQLNFNEQSLMVQQETVTSDEALKLTKEVDLQRDYLKSDSLGTLQSAKALLQLVKASKIATKEEIAKVLNAKKNKPILSQLYDVLGHAHTDNSHRAVMKVLHFDREEQTDLIERYLWAMSLSPRVNIEILEDLVDKFRKYAFIPEKTKKTLVLTLASMARTARSTTHHSKVVSLVEEVIINELNYAKGEDRYVYFAALKNLQSATSIGTLMDYVKNGTAKEEYLAWKALRSFDKALWTQDLLKLAENALYQLGKKRDSSSRTIATDIILGSKISDEKLSDLFNFIVSNETNYEIKQYVFQSLQMLADRDARIASLIKKHKSLYNYHGLAPRGLSTALRRSIFRGRSSEGSIVSVQEIKDGIVKRGNVEILLEKNDNSEELFNLGIFSSGLSSFVSNGDGEDEVEEESTTAGMELTILGTQIRPFVFFDGQGELMGHVWSGTASEMTPAFQALIMVQDHEEFVRLGTGFVAKLSFTGAASLDLSGKIEISLWNRNAQALIEKSVAYIAKGSVEVDSSIVKSSAEFSASIEPKLTLNIDADFSSKIKLCMRLAQPDSVFSQIVIKTERIPGSKHKIRIVRRKKSGIPGKTYALNRKNNEMCSAIFN